MKPSKLRPGLATLTPHFLYKTYPLVFRRHADKIRQRSLEHPAPMPLAAFDVGHADTPVAFRELLKIPPRFLVGFKRLEDVWRDDEIPGLIFCRVEDVGDGGKPRIDTAKVTYQYSAIGSFTAKVTAIGSDNKRDTATVDINVRPVSVTACFEPSSDRGPAPLQVAFDPTCSTGTVVKYTWTFGKAGASTDRKPVFTFTDPGTYDVILEVADAQNVIDTITNTITVLPKPTK